jgi:hypothetical protein
LLSTTCSCRVLRQNAATRCFVRAIHSPRECCVRTSSASVGATVSQNTASGCELLFYLLSISSCPVNPSYGQPPILGRSRGRERADQTKPVRSAGQRRCKKDRGVAHSPGSHRQASAARWRFLPYRGPWSSWSGPGCRRASPARGGSRRSRQILYWSGRRQGQAGQDSGAGLASKLPVVPGSLMTTNTTSSPNSSPSCPRRPARTGEPAAGPRACGQVL